MGSKVRWAERIGQEPLGSSTRNLAEGD